MFVSLAVAALALIWWLSPRFAPEERQAAAEAAELQKARIAEAARQPSTIDYRRLDSRLQSLAADDAVVGLAVGVVENGQIRFLKGYGVTTPGGEAVTASTIFRWASVSKGVAGDMVAKLAHEGKLSLQDPAGRHAPSLRLPNAIEQQASVANILSHTLGIFGHANDADLESGGDAYALRTDLASLNQICAPGQCHAYQNVAYDAASEIVGQVTGKPYQEVVRERLFLPLGMTSATLTREGLMSAKSWAKPHRGGKNSRAVEVTDSYYRVPAAGGVNSSIKDLALWMTAQMGLHPAVLPDAVLADVQTELVRTPGELGRMRDFRERLKNAHYGLGWRIYDYAGHRIVGHRGGVTGYRSLILFDPVRKSGVVALWNSSTNRPGGLEFEVMDMIYGLEFRDWLELGGAGAAEPTEAVTDSGN